MDQRLVLAERELCGFYLSAVAVRAQNYGAFATSNGHAHDWEEGFVSRFPAERKAMAERDKVARTLAYVGGWSRFVLELAYDRRSAAGVANPLLAAALTGAEVASLTALAPLTARAQRLAARELGADAAAEASHGTILRLLESKASEGAPLLSEVRQEALALRDEALSEYAGVMAERKVVTKERESDKFLAVMGVRS